MKILLYILAGIGCCTVASIGFLFLLAIGRLFLGEDVKDDDNKISEDKEDDETDRTVKERMP